MKLISGNIEMAKFIAKTIKKPVLYLSIHMDTNGDSAAFNKAGDMLAAPYLKNFFMEDCAIIICKNHKEMEPTLIKQ